ncbi:transposase [Blastococcus sp. PRF04-17]|uniref:transposase n=1 Tax=Blastococcus sp. PRF04-17 TaxID=2933797 RepID=UPI00352FF845
MRLAGRADRGPVSAGFAHLAGGDGRDRLRPRPDPRPRPGRADRRGPRRTPGLGCPAAQPPHPGGTSRGGRRRARSARSAARRAGTGRVRPGRPSARPDPAGPGRGADDRRARRTGPHRAGDHHPRLSAVGAAAILAETGDPARFDSGRAVVKHAGLCPRENASGAYAGKTTISGRGRPLLRVAAWRAVWAALQHNPVLAARHAHLTGRTANPLTDAQARVAVAGSLLRQLFVVVSTRTAWNPDIAAGLTDPRIEVSAPAA